MGDLAARLAMKERLPRAWPAFFERHGSFTPAQEAAIPALLDGHDALLVAPTASGKTEAVLAPLVERYCGPGGPGGPGARDAHGLAILYLVPTRALVNDLAARLQSPLETLKLRLAVRTGDRSTLRAGRPPDLLISTPESLDALLAARARLFATVRAVVIDELHLLDGTPRGDHLRALLARLHRVRAHAAAHGDAPRATLQVVALSATVAHPDALAARYCAGPRVLTVGGGRTLDAELRPLAAEGVGELQAYMGDFRARGWRKALVFCQTRAEVEAYAAAVREGSPFGDRVYVHYSNIEANRRRDTEERFASDAAAILFATGTLELGIDIGNVDIVILIGPPGSPASFMQRVGRGNRRRGITRAACFYRDPLERRLFEALLATGSPDDGRIVYAPTDSAGETPAHPHWERRLPAGMPSPTSASMIADAVDVTVTGCRLEAGAPGRHDASPSNSNRDDAPDEYEDSGGAPFRPAVAVQQIFSLIKANPSGAVRRAELRALLAGLLSEGDIDAILDELTRRRYLARGRPGDWTAGERLNDLFDQQGRKNCPLSIHSNIHGQAGRPIEVRDQHSGQVVATVDREWFDRPVLTLEGRPVSIEWQDGEALWVAAYKGEDVARRLRYRSRGQLLSHELARLLPATFGLPADAAPLVPSPSGWLLFHWLGDVYGHALYDLLRYRVRARETAQLGLCLELDDEPRALSTWTAEAVEQYCADSYRDLEPMLAMGPFQHLLPTDLRRRAVVAQFDVPRFLTALDRLRPARAPEALAADLSPLLDDRPSTAGVGNADP